MRKGYGYVKDTKSQFSLGVKIYTRRRKGRPPYQKNNFKARVLIQIG